MRYALFSIVFTVFQPCVWASHTDNYDFKKELIYALKNDNRAYIVKYIHEKDINQLTINGKTLLYYAVRYSSKTILEYLLEKGASCTDAQGREAIEGLKELIFSGSFDDQNFETFEATCQTTIIFIVERLLAYGSSIPSNLPYEDAIAIAYEKHETMQRALTERNLSLVLELINNGFYCSIYVRNFVKNSLDCALECSDYTTIQLVANSKIAFVDQIDQGEISTKSSPKQHTKDHPCTKLYALLKIILNAYTIIYQKQKQFCVTYCTLL